MPVPETLFEADPCKLANRWAVRQDVMRKVVRAAEIFERLTRPPKASKLPTKGIRVSIISGARTSRQQAELAKKGRPTAPVGRSTHTSCPATGVDVRLGSISPTVDLKLLWMRSAQLTGLRVGGGSTEDEAGLPIDWNHVDLGPRGDPSFGL